MFAQTGHYHGVVVRIKELKFSKKKDISRDVMKEMRILREIRHGNLNSFIGACVEPMRILLITDYCAKGSLYVRHLNTRMNGVICSCFQRMITFACVFQDIIENEDIKLDDMFIASLVHDLIKVSISLRTLERDVEYTYFFSLLGYAVHSRVICTSLSW